MSIPLDMDLKIWSRRKLIPQDELEAVEYQNDPDCLLLALFSCSFDVLVYKL